MRAALLALLVAPPAGGEPVKAHAKNPRHLGRRGKPVVLVTSGEQYGAVLNPDFDFVRYLDTLKADGMPYTRLFTGSYVEPVGAFGIERNTLAPWARSAVPGYAAGGTGFDLGRWDADYLKRLKAFPAAAAGPGGRGPAAGADAVHLHYARPEAAEWNAGLRLPVCCDGTGHAGRADGRGDRRGRCAHPAGGGGGGRGGGAGDARPTATFVAASGSA